MSILNLTQHPASLEQKEAGVVDLPTRERNELSNLLTFKSLPCRESMWDRANEVCAIARKYQENDQVLVGGAPFFTSILEAALEDDGFTPMYAFSQRVSEEKTQDDGSVVKVNVFKHLGFVST